MTPSSPLRLGIVGAGARSAHLLESIRVEPRVSVVAVQDPIREARERFAQAQQIDGYESYEELLDHVDVVVLTSPMPFHTPQTRAALERGVHVLTEVPAAVSLEQAHELVAAVRSTDTRFGVAENYIFMIPNLVARELIRAGELGEPYYAENENIADTRAGLALPDGSPRWQAYWWTGRNGPTYPTHALGPLLHWLDDRIEAVSCVGTGHHEVPELEIEDIVVLLARTVKGRLLRVTFSWLASRPISVHHYLVQGTGGAYDSGDPLRGVQPAIHLRGRSEGWEPLDAWTERVLPARYRDLVPAGDIYPADSPLRHGWGPADSIMIREFVDWILDDVPYPVDVHAALDMTLAGLVAESSIAQKGDWLHVPNSRFFTSGIGLGPGREAPRA